MNDIPNLADHFNLSCMRTIPLLVVLFKNITTRCVISNLEINGIPLERVKNQLPGPAVK